MKRVAVSFRDAKKLGPYLEALRGAELEPAPVSPENPVDSLAGFDGLMLSGGSDVDPSLYGQARDPRTEAPDRERDDFEQKLLREALAIDLPVLAICRGSQLFNVTHSGGTLIQHLEGHRIPNHGTHHAEIYGNTKLGAILGAGVHAVNSRHHQAVDRPGAGLVVAAKSPDGVVEALERPDRKFAIAVQWHPEDQLPVQHRLFQAFREAL